MDLGGELSVQGGHEEGRWTSMETMPECFLGVRWAGQWRSAGTLTPPWDIQHFKWDTQHFTHGIFIISQGISIISYWISIVSHETSNFSHGISII